MIATSPTSSQVMTSPTSSIVNAISPASSQVMTSPTPSMLSSGRSSCRDGEFKIPDHWRPEVEQAIKDRSLNPSVRSVVVRTLVDHLFEMSNKPGTQQCEEVARKLILKYPFFKDDLGNGYVSYLYCVCIQFQLWGMFSSVLIREEMS